MWVNCTTPVSLEAISQLNRLMAFQNLTSLALSIRQLRLLKSRASQVESARGSDGHVQRNHKVTQDPAFPDEKRKSKTMGGYEFVYMPGHPQAAEDGWILRARVVLERKIGRRLRPSEKPLFVNGDTMDSDPENLEVMVSCAT
jgi:hypothetical protein